MKKVIRKVICVVSLGAMQFIFPVDAFACQATLVSTGVVYSSIQAAANASANPDTINVNGLGGACNESVSFPNTAKKLFLIGSNNAVLNGSGATPALDIRTKGTLIQGITINGGQGVKIQRNANAVLDQVVVQSSGGTGIEVKELAFLVLTNSTVQSNSGAGVFLQSGAAANIGFNNDSDQAAQGNSVVSNGSSGIVLLGNSTAKIVGNYIVGNGNVGIGFGISSSALISGNVISYNLGSGIYLGGTSSAILSSTSLGGIFSALNSGSGNGQYGIVCGPGAYIEGHTGPGIGGNLGLYGDQNGTLYFNSACTYGALQY